MKARPNVLGLTGAVACIAIALAAVRSNDQLTTAVVFALTFLILGTSTLVALYRRRAWAGFAVCGWARFLICQPNAAPPVGATSLSERKKVSGTNGPSLIRTSSRAECCGNRAGEALG